MTEPTYLLAARLLADGHNTTVALSRALHIDRAQVRNVLQYLRRAGLAESRTANGTTKYWLTGSAERVEDHWRAKQSESSGDVVPLLERCWPVKQVSEIGVAGG